MSYDTLTDDDLDVLIEALEAWEHKDAASGMFGDIVEMMVTDRRDPVAKAQMIAEREKARRQREQEARARKERSILLRAKLIEIRNGRRVDQVERALLRGVRKEGAQ